MSAMTAGRIPDRRDRALMWGIAVSVLLHALLLLPGLRNAVQSLDIDMKPEPRVEPLEFTLVSPPETPTPTDQQSRFLSTVSSAASDLDRRDTDSDLPRSEGRIPVPDNPSRTPGEEGGGQSELPPLPVEQGGLSEAIQRSKFTEQISPRREPSLPDETHDFEHEGSASATIGGISLNTTEWDFAPYLLDLKRRIKQKWIPPIAFTTLGAVHGYTWVLFRIYPDGHMEGMEVVETEGHDSLHRSSSNAVKGAAPFRPLPADFPEPYLEITFGFYYLLPGDEERYFRNGRFIRKDDERSEP
ncbi:MAG: energy transducer TonB [Candidatus Krumholzibacteria bacterium]|nr:energy transducer TonB [Candidatus Krumholzibacteria bacterium]MDH4335900.1 energy transducer TonB [Candidatus Krumholzibacteria bacterium]MDH5268524.1 energy transducer TonB [Candidatus Krumholzibacteria bacterium]